MTEKKSFPKVLASIIDDSVHNVSGGWSSITIHFVRELRKAGYTIRPRKKEDDPKTFREILEHERERCARVADECHLQDEIDNGAVATGAAAKAAAAIRELE